MLRHRKTHPRRPKGRSQRQRKVSTGERKWRQRRAPGDTFLPDQFQTVGVILNSDWCQKFFVFFCPIRGQAGREVVSCLLTRKSLDRHTRLVCLARNVSITAQNVWGIVQNIGREIRWTFRRYLYSSVFPSVRDLFEDVLPNSPKKAVIDFDLTIIFIVPPFRGRGISRFL